MFVIVMELYVTTTFGPRAPPSKVQVVCSSVGKGFAFTVRVIETLLPSGTEAIEGEDEYSAGTEGEIKGMSYKTLPQLISIITMHS